MLVYSTLAAPSVNNNTGMVLPHDAVDDGVCTHVRLSVCIGYTYTKVGHVRGRWIMSGVEARTPDRPIFRVDVTCRTLISFFDFEIA